jgi:hypothetical protein
MANSKNNNENNTIVKRKLRNLISATEKLVETVGSKAMVFHGSAKKTAGGLKKKDLFKDKDGNIKSKKASAAAKKNNNLGDFKAKKGKKGEFNKAPKKGTMAYNQMV